jgi:hypothetical protein
MGKPSQIMEKKLFCAKSMTTLGDLTVYVFYFYFRWLSVVNSFLSDETGIHSKSTDFTPSGSRRQAKSGKKLAPRLLMLS